MDLKEYFDNFSKESIDEFSRKNNISRASIYEWMNKTTRPTIRSARRMEQATEKKVTFEEMRSINHVNPH